MSIAIFCGCLRYNSTCSLCRSGKRAYIAGLRAYRQGKSRHTRHGHGGFGYRWTDGWYDGRNANPNTEKQREKEKIRETGMKIRRLKRERSKIDRKIRSITI